MDTPHTAGAITPNQEEKTMHRIAVVLIGIAATALLAGCNTTQVAPRPSASVQHVVIDENKVLARLTGYGAASLEGHYGHMNQRVAVLVALLEAREYSAAKIVLNTINLPRHTPEQLPLLHQPAFVEHMRMAAVYDWRFAPADCFIYPAKGPDCTPAQAAYAELVEAAAESNKYEEELHVAFDTLTQHLNKDSETALEDARWLGISLHTNVMILGSLRSAAEQYADIVR